ncbi:unnamed protein product [Echinostoma caproni]|uniref:Uncharacterized protein n=1 Tax=Echinostoma caproni TaxID=27848 RepID=A0A183B7D3_9TREM|nr:unnamed protein product [Echinostoma caproni]
MDELSESKKPKPTQAITYAPKTSRSLTLPSSLPFKHDLPCLERKPTRNRIPRFSSWTTSSVYSGWPITTGDEPRSEVQPPIKDRPKNTSREVLPKSDIISIPKLTRDGSESTTAGLIVNTYAAQAVNATTHQIVQQNSIGSTQDQFWSRSTLSTTPNPTWPVSSPSRGISGVQPSDLYISFVFCKIDVPFT